MRSGSEVQAISNAVKGQQIETQKALEVAKMNILQMNLLTVNRTLADAFWDWRTRVRTAIGPF